jgi:hypothetical protein
MLKLTYCTVYFVHMVINKNNTSYYMVYTVPRTLYDEHMTRPIKKPDVQFQ